jgi:hypothetical protein
MKKRQHRPHTDNSLIYISRYDGAAWRGYQVNVPGKRSRLCSVSTYGSWRKALVAAKAYRDKIAPGARYAIERKKTARNTSGHVGIKRHLVHGGYYSWLAQWQESPKKTVRRWFSEAKYGRKTAKALAIKARAAGLGERARQEQA